MRYLTIIFSIIFLLTACNEKSNQALMGKKAAKFILGDESAETIVWQLVSTKDPYDGGKFYPQDPANPHYILMHHNGSFKEQDNANVSFGNWYINQNKDRLALVYYIENGISIPNEKQVLDYRYVIKKVSKDSLLLDIQGRHGMVTKTYLNSTSVPPKIRTNPWDNKVPEIDLNDESIWKGAEEKNENQNIETWDTGVKTDTLYKDPDSLKNK